MFFGKRVDDDLDVHPACNADQNENVGVDALERRLTGADILLKDNAEAFFGPVQHPLELHGFHITLPRDQNLAQCRIMHGLPSSFVFFIIAYGTRKIQGKYLKSG